MTPNLFEHFGERKQVHSRPNVFYNKKNTFEFYKLFISDVSTACGVAICLWLGGIEAPVDLRWINGVMNNLWVVCNVISLMQYV